MEFIIKPILYAATGAVVFLAGQYQERKFAKKWLNHRINDLNDMSRIDKDHDSNFSRAKSLLEAYRKDYYGK